MEIVKQSETKFAEKPDGTSVSYYIFPEYEIHFNKLPAGAIQQWHHHSRIEEVIYVVSGVIECHWVDNDTQLSQTVRVGDVVRVGTEIHTLENSQTEPATFLTIRLVLTGNDYRSLFRTDKMLD